MMRLGTQGTQGQALTKCQKFKSRREIWNPFFQFREEKYQDLSSGSRRERELREIFTKILCGEEKEKFQEEKEKF